MPDLSSRADVGIHRFVTRHRGYTIAPKQPTYRGGTNRITLGRWGWWNGDPSHVAHMKASAADPQHWERYMKFANKQSRTL